MKNMFKVVTFCLAMLQSSMLMAAGAQFEDGVAAFHRGDFAAARDIIGMYADHPEKRLPARAYMFAMQDVKSPHACRQPDEALKAFIVEHTDADPLYRALSAKLHLMEYYPESNPQTGLMALAGLGGSDGAVSAYALYTLGLYHEGLFTVPPSPANLMEARLKYKQAYALGHIEAGKRYGAVEAIEEADALCNHGSDYASRSQYDEAINYFETALDMGVLVPAQKAIALSKLGYCYHSTGQHAEAILYLTKALDMKVLDPEQKALALAFLGHAYYSGCQYSQAIPYLRDALGMKVLDPEQKALALVFLGHAYYSGCQYSQAIPYLMEALDMKVLVPAKKASVLLTLGHIDYLTGQYPKALLWLKDIDMNVLVPGQKAIALSKLGHCYLLTGQYPEALLCLQDIDMRVLDSAQKALALANLGIAYCHQNQKAQSIPCLTQALAINSLPSTHKPIVLANLQRSLVAVGVPQGDLGPTINYLIAYPDLVNIFVHGIKGAAGQLLLTPAETRAFVFKNSVSPAGLADYVGSEEFRAAVTANAALPQAERRTIQAIITASLPPAAH